MQGAVGSIGHGNQVVGTERQSAAIAVELVAAGAEVFAADGAAATVVINDSGRGRSCAEGQ